MPDTTIPPHPALLDETAPSQSYPHSRRYSHPVQSLLRFITCGSVDDGKSTLIGRLLFETNDVADDQLTALRTASKRYGTQGGDVDFALLLDGLSAEREQGITIDVGYRYFSTPRRRFIVADTPGHVQYTRNMATAASTASLAVLLVDARAGLLDQTRRHSLIVSMLGVRHIVVAVNKMDLVDFSEQRFLQLDQAYRQFAETALPHGARPLRITCIPISAKGGDNVVGRSDAMPWYRGPTLLEHLENTDVDLAEAALPFRMPVQWVNRPSSEFRGYAGLVVSGIVQPGDAVQVWPSGVTSQVDRIVTADGELGQAQAGQAVTLTLADEIDISRGDMITRTQDTPPSVSAELTARLLWVDGAPAVAMRSYLMKIGTASVPARLDPPLATLEVETGVMVPAEPGASMPGLNGIALVPVRLDLPVAFDRYDVDRGTGGFILIDRTTNMTVAMGMIEQDSIPKPQEPGGLRGWLTRVRERPWRSLAKAVSWRATGSLDTFIVTLVISGNARLAASVGGLEVFTKIFLYFVHERVWARIPLGLKGR